MADIDNPIQFYFDESGHTGGMSQQSFKSSYGGQKIFTLAAIGITDEDELNKKIAPLLGRYKIHAKELKSSKLYKKKPHFIAEVFTLIKTENWPIFIEAVDKKFMLTANVVNSLIFPGYCFDTETRQTNYIRNVFAEYLYSHMSDSLYVRFLDLCTSPSVNGLNILIDELVEVLQRSENEVSSAIIQSLGMTRDDVEENLLGKGDDISSFLPIPDIGKHGKTVWILPNLSSFTNIYARINRFMKGDLSGVKLLHDEQLQYDCIIEAAKRDLENLPSENFGFISDSSDYKLKTSAQLLFKTSHESLGIQIADLIAGFVRRYIEQTRSNQVMDNTICEAFKTLMTMNRQEVGLGMNMVLSAQDLANIARV